MQRKLENMARTVSRFLPESRSSIMLARLLLILEDLGSNPHTCHNLHWPGFEPTTPRVEGNQMRYTELSQGVWEQARSALARSTEPNYIHYHSKKKTLLLKSLGWIKLVIAWNLRQRWGRTLASPPSFWGSIPRAYNRWFLIGRATKTWKYGTNSISVSARK